MKFARAWALIGILFFCQRLATAQQQYEFQFRDDVKIVIDSDTVKNPWVGGLNSPVFSKIDLDQDGTEDLFAYDRTHNKIFTFLARQTKGQWQWQHAPQYEVLFPEDLTGWVLLRDYDRDGRRDIFTKTNFGIKVYRNTTAPNSLLAFEVAENYIKFENNFNLQVSSENLPAILDMDEDGDLDILSFDFASSSRIEYYKNLQEDQNLMATTLKYTKESATWANVSKCEHVCNGFVFNGSCRTSGTNATLHAEGMALLALDLDGDADKDVLIGGEACSELAKITNSGTLNQAAMTGLDLQTNYPNNTTPASFKDFPAAYYEDIDFDDKKDLLIAPFARSNTADDINFGQSVWYYKNTGTATPDFTFQSKDFLQADMVDLGEQSAPALADVDADGDQDMLVGHRQGSIWFFRNVGNGTKAVFKLESKDYLGLTSADFRDIKPQFADINSDGKLDLILAVTTGTTGAIKYLLNTAATNKPFNFEIAQIKTLPVGMAMGSVPAFYDLDNDGDKDLVLANTAPTSPTSGILEFYRNTSSAANPVFTLEKDAWGNIPIELARRNSYPLITDLNQDDKPELLLVDDTGELRIYSNIINDLNSTFTGVSEIFLNTKTNNYQASKLGGFVTLAAADLNGDQKPEIITGSRGGGLTYMSQQTRGVLGTDKPQPEPINFSIFPNPANRWVKIESPEVITYTIVNVAGQRLSQESNFKKNHQVNVVGLKPGLYFLLIQTKDLKRASYKLIIQK